ncbi:MAG: hypothetical protein KIH67_004285 [Candidatus Moranbacteria bacterium]|nr:hypothetical protein [Candidatus Moranbacteria bacterium]
MRNSQEIQFIALAGVDGSGKSTQVEKVMEALLANGHKVAYFHAIEFSLANRLSRLLRAKKTFAPGEEKAVTKASLLSLILREKFMILDCIRFHFWKRTLRLDGYDTILSDRSFYDSLINIEYLNREKKSKLIAFGIQCLTYIIPKADQVFFFDLKASDIMSRSRVPEQGEKYLEEKLELYQKYNTVFCLTSIDATQSEETILANIMSSLSGEHKKL